MKLKWNRNGIEMEQNDLTLSEIVILIIIQMKVGCCLRDAFNWFKCN